MNRIRYLSMGIALFLFIQSFAFAADDCEKQLVKGSTVEEIAEKKVQALKVAPSFKAYFDSMKTRLLEREYLVDILELALIAKEHILLMGPPGNAKSMLADTGLGNILDTATSKNSYYRIQMTPETTMSETHGPLDFKTLTATGKYERLYDEGMLNSRNVFIDEIFDGRANAMRNILGLLAERAHAQGPRIIKGKIETVVAATNKYIDEVYDRARDDSPKALLDRFAFSAFVPGELEELDSSILLIQNAKKSEKEISHFTFEELDQIRELVTEVEIPRHVAKFLALLTYKIKSETESMEQSSLKIYKDKFRNGEEATPPYRATKYLSPRTLAKSAGILKAIVVQEWLKSAGKRALKANIEDVQLLNRFFTLNGPNEIFLAEQLERSSNPHERSQLQAIIQERQIFQRSFEKISNEINSATYKYALTDLQSELDSKLTEAEKEALSKKLIAMFFEIQSSVIKDSKLATLTGEAIGRDLVSDYLKEALTELLGEKYASTVEAVLREHEEAQRIAQLELKKKEIARIKAEEEVVRKEIERKASIQKLNLVYSSMDNFKTVILDTFGSEAKVWALTPDGNQAVLWEPATGLHVLRAGEKNRFFNRNNENSALASVLSEERSSITEIYCPDSDHVVLMTGSQGLIFNLNKDSLVDEFSTGSQSAYISKTISSDGQSLWVLDPTLGRVIKFDLKTGNRTVVTTINSYLGSTDLKTALKRISIRCSDFFVSSNQKKAILITDQMEDFYELDFETGVLKHQGSTQKGRYNFLGASEDLSRFYGYSAFSIAVNIIEVPLENPSKVKEMKVPMNVQVKTGAVFEDATIAIFTNAATDSENKDTSLQLVDLTSGTKLNDSALKVTGAHRWNNTIRSFKNNIMAFWTYDQSLAKYVFKVLKKK